MINESELLINVVNNDKPKMLTGLNQKVCGRMLLFPAGSTRTTWPPAKRQGLTHPYYLIETR